MSNTISNAFPNVLVAGATGRLGTCFVNALVESPFHFKVHILVRDSTDKDPAKKALLDGFKAKGVHIVHGDVSRPDTLPAALKGIDVVISTLGGEGLFGGNGEVELVRAAKAAGVKRFVPSQFGSDIYELPLGANAFLDTKVRTLEELKKTGLDYIVFSTNSWLEFTIGSGFIGCDAVHENKVHVPGGGNSHISLTSIVDVPRLAIPAIIDTTLHNAHVRLAADTLTWNQILDKADHILGKKIERVYTSAAEYGQLIQSNPNPMAKFGFAVALAYAAQPEKADFRTNAYNIEHPERYSHVKVSSIEQFIQNSKAH